MEVLPKSLGSSSSISKIRLSEKYEMTTRWTSMNVLNKEYQQLQEQIQSLSEKWSAQLENVTLAATEHLSSIQHFPALPHLKLNVNFETYRNFILELYELLEKNQPSLADDFKKLSPKLTDETLEHWFKEAVAVNNFYFDKYAKEQQVAEWLPFFAAEQAIRPFLQKISSEIAPLLKKDDGIGGCPSCGEPPRVAVINKSGKKEITCPRCLYAWEVKKIKCAHCGNEEPGKIEVLKVEKDDRAEVHVCEDCHGYTKVIDTRKLIKKEPIQLLDLKTIHLDFIAQENGYGEVESEETH